MINKKRFKTGGYSYMNKRALEFELQNFDYMVYLC